MNDISSRLQSVREQVAAAARNAGRDPGDVELVAVSKAHGPLAVREAFDAGQRVFGESRAQEMIAKVPGLPSATRWHFIGHLQKNKIRKILPLVELIHAVDSVELAMEIDRIGGERLFPRVLLEVNVAGEQTKFGFTPAAVRQQIERLLVLPRVQIEGLMTIAPIAERAEDARPIFAELRALRDSINREASSLLTTLSMGMSADFVVAVQEGQLFVRVGSAIFGRGRIRSETVGESPS
jgi:pyridoxal phosphate enzyme (YggS family)